MDGEPVVAVNRRHKMNFEQYRETRNKKPGDFVNADRSMRKNQQASEEAKHRKAMESAFFRRPPSHYTSRGGFTLRFLSRVYDTVRDVLVFLYHFPFLAADVGKEWLWFAGSNRRLAFSHPSFSSLCASNRKEREVFRCENFVGLGPAFTRAGISRERYEWDKDLANDRKMEFPYDHVVAHF